MPIATTPSQTREWVLPEEKNLPAAQQTVFVLRAVSYAVRQQFGVLIGRTGAESNEDILASIDPDDMARMFVLAIKASLVGWRNFRDETGAEVPFVAATVTISGVPLRGAASDESLERLDLATMAALGTECLLGMVLTKRDVLG